MVTKIIKTEEQYNNDYEINITSEIKWYIKGLLLNNCTKEKKKK